MNRLVFTAYQRPFYWGPVLESWNTARGFADWQPTAFLEPSTSQAAMSRIAHWNGVNVTLNTRRWGVLTNPWIALDTTFRAGATFVVLAEDDVLVSDDILEYFTWAAAEFADSHILTVCACSYDPVCAPGNEQQTVRTKRFTSLVWGTWIDRWTNVLRDTWDHEYSSGTTEYPQSGWDWNINLRVMADWDVLAPTASRSTHIGERLGAHTTPDSFPESKAPTFRAHRPAAPFKAPSNR